MEMARKLFGVIVFFAAFWIASALNVRAQIPTTPFVDHWSTAAGTPESTDAAEKACLAATDSPFYHPSILSKRPLRKNEVIRGIPVGACVETELPDRLGGRGFVRLEAGRPGVYDLLTGKLLQIAECNNDIYKFVPFTLLRGLPGTPGLPGKDGYTPIKGVDYFDGKDGYTPVKGVDYFDGKDATATYVGGGGFCSNKKCRIGGGAVITAIIYGIYRFWPCPPGTVQR